MTLPSRLIEDQQVYVASCKREPDLTFSITAPSEISAKVELLDKVGWTVSETTGGIFRIVDADDEDLLHSTLKATSLVAAIEEAVTAIGWSLSEPTELLGGSMGAGFGIEEKE